MLEQRETYKDVDEMLQSEVASGVLAFALPGAIITLGIVAVLVIL